MQLVRGRDDYTCRFRSGPMSALVATELSRLLIGQKRASRRSAERTARRGTTFPPSRLMARNSFRVACHPPTIFQGHSLKSLHGISKIPGKRAEITFP